MAIFLVLSFLSGSLLGYFLFGSEGGGRDGREYYLPPPEGWHRMGRGTKEDYQQCFCYGDFDGDGEYEVVGSYSHSAVGVFIHRRAGGKWRMEVLHPKFDPSLNHVRGMDGGWPVKGLTSGDFDGDGIDEIITYADAVNFPPAHGNGSDTIPFPGAIYIDYVKGKGFVANPLIWGRWGEEISSRRAAIMLVYPVSSSFRGTPEGGLMDFIVSTLHESHGEVDGRIYVLQQPSSTFNSVDYRYTSPGRMDSDMTYPHEPFYFKHLYLGEEEMIFSPSDFPGARTAYVGGVGVLDYNHDGLEDLVVSLTYYDSDNEILGGSVRVFKRLPIELNRTYRFEEVFRRDLIGIGFGWVEEANLDGDGVKDFVFECRANSQRRSFGVSGVATLRYVNGVWELRGTHCSDRFMAEINYEYSYSHPAVLDADGDGYDDVVINIVRRTVKREDGTYFAIGDLVLFLNQKGKLKEFDGFFSLDYSTVLWGNDSFSWDVHVDDYDGDGAMEVGVALCRKEPYPDGLFGIYYLGEVP
ncbi:MAG: hypothetical protein J7L88_05530 [Thermoplasmata archaeon]|nr:hypothetical protein [Thermoplasmata archaeon]